MNQPTENSCKSQNPSSCRFLQNTV